MAGSAPLRLVGTTEISIMFGVGRARADQLQKKPSFPAPAAKIAAGRVYHYDEVVEWARNEQPPRPVVHPLYLD